MFCQCANAALVLAGGRQKCRDGRLKRAAVTSTPFTDRSAGNATFGLLSFAFFFLTILPWEAFTVALHKRTTVGKVMDGKGRFVFLNFCVPRRFLLKNNKKMYSTKTKEKKIPQTDFKDKTQQVRNKKTSSHQGQDRSLASSVT